MFTLSKALLISKTTNMVRLDGLLLKSSAIVLFILCNAVVGSVVFCNRIIMFVYYIWVCY